MVVHDSSCHMRKFADDRAEQSPAAAALAYPQIRYITDGFHSRGHVDAWCLANCAPSLPENSALLDGVNTSICEQTFRVTNRFRFMVQHMHQSACTELLNEIAEARNAAIAKRR